MITEVITLGILVSALGGYTFYDSRRMDRKAKENEEKIREDTLDYIEASGLEITDFPKYIDALKGERHLKVSEVVDIHYICKTRGRGTYGLGRGD